MPILNYTTSIAADKTIAEIQKTIVSKGAKKIMIDYENGLPCILSFQIIHNNGPISFRLPANWRGVLKAMVRQGVSTKLQTEKQALNVCWRIIKTWVEGQMALIESEQADLATVFISFAVMENGKTVWENMLSIDGNKLLPYA